MKTETERRKTAEKHAEKREPSTGQNQLPRPPPLAPPRSRCREGTLLTKGTKKQRKKTTQRSRGEKERQPLPRPPSTTADDHNRAFPLQVTFSPPLPFLFVHLHLHAEREQFTFCSK
jgi:hypothetical protein